MERSAKLEIRMAPEEKARLAEEAGERQMSELVRDRVFGTDAEAIGSPMVAPAIDWPAYDRAVKQLAAKMPLGRALRAARDDLGLS
jgi:hypothetical protein